MTDNPKLVKELVDALLQDYDNNKMLTIGYLESQLWHMLGVVEQHDEQLHATLCDNIRLHIDARKGEGA